MATSTINNPNIYTKVWTVDLDSVSGANGAYSHNTTVPKMTTDYKPILFECDNPSIFKDTVNISTGQNTVTLSCNNAIGSTTGVKASFVLQGDADTLSSAEYQALGSRIGDLNNLTTDDKGNIVESINSLNLKNSWYYIYKPLEGITKQIQVPDNISTVYIFMQYSYNYPASNELAKISRGGSLTHITLGNCMTNGNIPVSFLNNILSITPQNTAGGYCISCSVFTE